MAQIIVHNHFENEGELYRKNLEWLDENHSMFCMLSPGGDMISVLADCFKRFGWLDNWKFIHEFEESTGEKIQTSTQKAAFAMVYSDIVSDY